MKLLSRSKSKHDKEVRAPEPPSRLLQKTEQRPSTSHRHLPRQSRLHDVQLRPQTADASTTNRNSNRLSLFEAFKIESGNDVFTFPRPLSARTVQSEFKAAAARSPSRQSPTTIGLACGSPAHPPPEWHENKLDPARIQHAPTTRLDAVENAYGKEFEDDLAPLPQTQHKRTWRKFGGLFRRHTRDGRSRKSQAQFDDGRPRLQRRTRTEPINMPSKFAETTDDLSSQQEYSTIRPERFAQGSARSTAKMQSILGVERLKDLERDSNMPTQSNSTPPRSHPFRQLSLKKANHAPARTMDRTLPPVPSLEPNTVKPLPPRLELELPSCKLDRYSIMFEDVLDPEPSLFERRRSRLITTGAPTQHTQLQQTKLATLSPIAQSISEHASPNGWASPQAILSIDTRPKTSPLPPEVPMKDTPPTTSVRPDHPNNAFPTFSPFTLQAASATDDPRDRCQTSLTFFDSPSSDDEDDDDGLSPQTPLAGSPEYPKVHVFSDVASQHIAATSTVGEHKEMSSNVWHAVLPPPPQSSTSSRFSLDIHEALESPSLPKRSSSFNGRGRASSRSPQRSPQVAVARSISVSKMRKGSVRRTDSKKGHRPKVIQVGAQAQPRKSFVLDDDLERRVSTHYGLAI